MKSVSEINDQEKSVMLARLVWRQYQQPNGTSLFYDDGASDYPIWSTRTGKTLYDPANMALAWRVLNWAYFNPGGKRQLHDAFMKWWDLQDGRALISFPPADAQRAWLDKILTLAIEAGMVTE